MYRYAPVKLQSWMAANYHDVVAMYEDWHSLMGLDEAGDIVTRWGLYKL